MAALRSAQAFIGNVTTVAPTTVYTVPAGKRFVLKHVTVQNTTGLSKNVQLRLGGIGTIYNWQLTAYGSGGDRAASNFWIVLNAGDTIQLNPTVAGQIDVTLSGSLLTV